MEEKMDPEIVQSTKNFYGAPNLTKSGISAQPQNAA